MNINFIGEFLSDRIMDNSSEAEPWASTPFGAAQNRIGKPLIDPVEHH